MFDHDMKWWEFLELKQGQNFVLEYEIKFYRLATFFPELVVTEETERFKFEYWLNHVIKDWMTISEEDTYARVLQWALKIE